MSSPGRQTAYVTSSKRKQYCVRCLSVTATPRASIATTYQTGVPERDAELVGSREEGTEVTSVGRQLRPHLRVQVVLLDELRFDIVDHLLGDLLVDAVAGDPTVAGKRAADVLENAKELERSLDERVGAGVP